MPDSEGSPMPHVFISQVEENAAFAEALAEALEKRDNRRG
jgi:hypothetical protein